VDNLLARNAVSIGVSAGASAGVGICSCFLCVFALLFYRRKKKKDPLETKSAVFASQEQKNIYVNDLFGEEFSKTNIKGYATTDGEFVNNPLFVP
jgi:hypothetical protein